MTQMYKCIADRGVKGGHIIVLGYPRWMFANEVFEFILPFIVCVTATAQNMYLTHW